MDMKEFDGIVKGVIAAAIIGLFGWVMMIDSDVKVNTTNISHNSDATKASIEATKELAQAVNDLRVLLAEKMK